MFLQHFINVFIFRAICFLNIFNIFTFMCNKKKVLPAHESHDFTDVSGEDEANTRCK